MVHGPRRASPVVYDAWLAELRARRPCFEFIDPPFRHSLAVALAFAATASRPTAVLSSPLWAAGDEAMKDVPQHVEDAYDMVRVRLDGHPLTATAAVAWNGDLPRHLQQLLFDTADAGVCPSDRHAPGWGTGQRVPIEEQLERVALGLGYAILPKGIARFYHRRDIRYLPVAGLDEVQVALAQPKARPMPEFDRFARIARRLLGGVA